MLNFLAHVDRFEVRIFLAHCRTNLYTKVTSCTILWGYLKNVNVVFAEWSSFGRNVFEGQRSIEHFLIGNHLRADGRMRTYGHTLVTLRTYVLVIPNRDKVSNTAL